MPRSGPVPRTGHIEGVETRDTHGALAAAATTLGQPGLEAEDPHRERLEPPHVTGPHRTLAWRWNLRSCGFMDADPPSRPTSSGCAPSGARCTRTTRSKVLRSPDEVREAHWRHALWIAPGTSSTRRLASTFHGDACCADILLVEVGTPGGARAFASIDWGTRACSSTRP